MSRPKTINPETRRAIVRHGLICFARGGYAAVSIREITEAAGVTRPMVYYYFHSKEDLYRTLLARSFEILDELLSEAKTRDRPPRERLIEIVKAYFRFCLEHPERVRFINRAFTVDEQTMPAIDCEALLRPRFQEIADVVVDGRRRGVFGATEPHAVAVALIGIIRMYVDKQLECDTRILTDALSEHVVGLIVDGIKADGGG